jgi:hypothetical protein
LNPPASHSFVLLAIRDFAEDGDQLAGVVGDRDVESGNDRLGPVRSQAQVKAARTSDANSSR